MTANQAIDRLKMAGYTVTWRGGDELVIAFPGRGDIGVLFVRHGDVHDLEVEMFIDNAERHRL